MIILKRKVSNVDPRGTPDFTRCENEKVLEIRTEDCLLVRWLWNKLTQPEESSKLLV
jgi:hypothetical protein